MDFCFDIDGKDLLAKDRVRVEIIHFINKYFPEYNNNQTKIIITDDLSRVARMLCEKEGIPANLIIDNAQGFAIEINGVIFLVFDYKFVGFPYLFQRRDDNPDNFWQKVKEYI